MWTRTSDSHGGGGAEIGEWIRDWGWTVVGARAGGGRGRSGWRSDAVHGGGSDWERAVGVRWGCVGGVDAVEDWVDAHRRY